LSPKPERFTLTTMRKRIDEVGDLTAGYGAHKASLMPRFEKMGLEPAHPNELDAGHRRGRVQRWESEQAGWRQLASSGSDRRATRRRRPPP
jgi:hypothetical protein